MAKAKEQRGCDTASRPKEGNAPRRKGSSALPTVPSIINHSLLLGPVREIPLSDIKLADDTFQFRVSLNNQELTRSIESEGQQFPIILRGRRPPYQLVCGFRRVAALQELGRGSAKALVLPEMSKQEAFRLSFLENRERASLSDLDIANAVAKLKMAGKKQKDIARIVGRSVRQIQRYVQVASFPVELRRAISSGRIALGHGLVLNRALVEGSRIDIPSWLHRIEEKKLSIPALKRHLNEVLGKQRRVHYLRKRGRGFTLAAFAFDPAKTTPRERKGMLAALRRAITMLARAK